MNEGSSCFQISRVYEIYTERHPHGQRILDSGLRFSFVSNPTKNIAIMKIVIEVSFTLKCTCQVQLCIYILKFNRNCFEMFSKQNFPVSQLYVLEKLVLLKPQMWIFNMHMWKNTHKNIALFDSWNGIITLDVRLWHTLCCCSQGCSSWGGWVSSLHHSTGVSEQASPKLPRSRRALL